jgi:hypothetical protein
MPGPSKAELAELIKKQQTVEMLKEMQMQFSSKLGAVMAALLQQFSPNLHVGMHALTNVLTTTAARSKIDKEMLLDLVGKQYDANAEALNKALAGESTPEDAQPATVDAASGAHVRLVEPSTH